MRKVCLENLTLAEHIEGKRKATSNLLGKFEQPESRTSPTKIKWGHKRSHIVVSGKRQEAVKKHDCSHPEGTCQRQRGLRNVSPSCTFLNEILLCHITKGDNNLTFPEVKLCCL